MRVTGVSVTRWCMQPWTSSGSRCAHALTLTGAATTWALFSIPLPWPCRATQVRRGQGQGVQAGYVTPANQPTGAGQTRLCVW
jgi:hypothetical protein